jgi:hypothetical protein
MIEWEEHITTFYMRGSFFHSRCGQYKMYLSNGHVSIRKSNSLSLYGEYYDTNLKRYNLG